MKIGMYRLEGETFATGGAKIYRAVCEDAPEHGLFFALKEYVHPVTPENALYKERAITNEIENYASKCVVIPILQVLRQDGRQFGLMQMKENGAFLEDACQKLEERYGKGGIPLGLILAIVREILISLEALHLFYRKGEAIGYAHLDLHPKNIFLESFDAEMGEAGRAKFIDFLTARKVSWKLPGVECTLAAEDNPIYAVTEGFSAPELYLANGSSLGIWTDIFAVCSIFYRLYTGKCMERYAPAAGGDLSSGTRAFNEEVAREDILRHAETRRENPVIAHMLAAFIRCGMEENSCYRYRNAAECRETLQEIADCLDACGEAVRENGEYDRRPDYEKMLKTAWHMLLPEEEILVERIRFDAGRFGEAIRAQHARIGMGNFDTGREDYLFSVYWKLFVKNQKNVSKEVYHILLNDGLICRNHGGDLSSARELYRRLEESRQGMPLLDYFQITNNAAGTLARMYEHEEAYHVVRRNVTALGKIRRAQLEAGREVGFTDPKSFYLKAYARGLSAMGMHMASLEARGLRAPKERPWEVVLPFRDSAETVCTEIDFPLEIHLCDLVPEDPMTAFFMAHRLFGEKAGNGGDWGITARHILHYAIQIDKEALFDRYAAGVFGKNDENGVLLADVGVHGIRKEGTKSFWGYATLVECMDDILEKKELRFTMHAFLKGVYAFYLDRVDDVFVDALLRLLEHPKLRATVSVPVELVFRYIGLILWAYTDRIEKDFGGSGELPKRVEKLRQGAMRAFRQAVKGVQGAIIRPEAKLSLRMCMTYQTKAILQELTGAEEKEKERLRKELLEHAEHSDWRELAETIRKGRKLSELLVMEYC